MTGTALVVVTTNAADSAAVAAWLRHALPADEVVVAVGYYPGVAAVTRGTRAVVAQVGPPAGREGWRVADLRHRTPEAAIVVVADALHLPALAGTLHAELAVTSVDGLPPLRELLLGGAPLTDDGLRDDQTIWRRTTR